MRTDFIAGRSKFPDSRKQGFSPAKIGCGNDNIPGLKQYLLYLQPYGSIPILVNNEETDSLYQHPADIAASLCAETGLEP